MEWKEFHEKYDSLSEEFNVQSFDERCRVSRLMAYDAIRELIRSKKYLRDAIDKIDNRIKELIPSLKEINKKTPLLKRGLNNKVNF